MWYFYTIHFPCHRHPTESRPWLVQRGLTKLCEFSSGSTSLSICPQNLPHWSRGVGRDTMQSSKLHLPLIFTKLGKFHFIKCSSELPEVMWCERQSILWLENELGCHTDEGWILILPFGNSELKNCAYQWLPHQIHQPTATVSFCSPPYHQLPYYAIIYNLKRQLWWLMESRHIVMASFMCQLSWPPVHRYVVKHYSGCFSPLQEYKINLYWIILMKQYCNHLLIFFKVLWIQVIMSCYRTSGLPNLVCWFAYHF